MYETLRHPQRYEDLDNQAPGHSTTIPDPPPKRKGGSGEYSAASHHRLVNWRCAKWVCKV